MFYRKCHGLYEAFFYFYYIEKSEIGISIFCDCVCSFSTIGVYEQHWAL